MPPYFLNSHRKGPSPASHREARESLSQLLVRMKKVVEMVQGVG